MSRCACPNCGCELTITAGAAPRQQSPPSQQGRAHQGQPPRKPTNPHGPSNLAEALDYELPLGKHKGRRLREVVWTDPDWIHWGAATLDRGAGKACLIVSTALEAGVTLPDGGPEPEPAQTPSSRFAEADPDDIAY